MPDIITFNRLAEILGVDLNYFSENFQPGDIESNPDSQREQMASDETVKLPGELPTEKQNRSVSLYHPETGKAGNKLSWDMSRGNWVAADFSGLKNLHEKFSSSNMQHCRFNGSDLSGLLLKTNNVNSCDFSGSDISTSHIQGSNLLKNIFKDCSLNETEFSGSNIESCDFSGANLTGTEFSKSNIYGCNFNGADFTRVVIKSGGFTGVVVKSDDFKNNTMENAVWNRTSFIDTQIVDLIFEGKLEDCYFENCEFTRVTFRNATLINTFFKNNKKLKRIRFMDCNADRISYEFLKQGNADLSGIKLLLQ